MSRGRRTFRRLWPFRYCGCRYAGQQYDGDNENKITQDTVVARRCHYAGVPPDEARVTSHIRLDPLITWLARATTLTRGHMAPKEATGHHRYHGIEIAISTNFKVNAAVAFAAAS